MALAGLWENWRSPAGEWVRTFAIITTVPNELCANLHYRMPVVLGREAGLARGGAGGLALPQSSSRALSIRSDDLLAGQPARRQCQVQ